MVLLYYFSIISQRKYNFNTTFCKKTYIFLKCFVLFAYEQMSSHKKSAALAHIYRLKQSTTPLTCGVVFFIKAHGGNRQQIVPTS